MANFIEFKKQFTQFKQEYEAQEQTFLKEVFCYIADKSEEFYQNNLKEAEIGKTVTKMPFYLKDIVFSIDTLQKIRLDVHFNFYEHDLQITTDNYSYLDWKQGSYIHSSLSDFAANTVMDKTFSETLYKWLEKNDRKLKIICNPSSADEMLDNQFVRIWGHDFR